MTARRRIDWPALALYVGLGGAGLAFVGWVLWRLALSVDWVAAALLGFVIVFGLLMVSFDVRRRDVDEPAPAPADAPAADAAPPPARRRGRPRKSAPGAAALAREGGAEALARNDGASRPRATAKSEPEPAATRGPRNRAGRAPAALPEPPVRARRSARPAQPRGKKEP